MEKILNNLLKNKKSLLGAGPMSRNIINAIIEVSDKYNIPLQLIASRRQIDSNYHGGGYVNQWSTEDFSNYVSNKSQKKLVFLSRDHSGPWQGDFDVKNRLDAISSMESCKKSLEEDIDQGFKFLHIDPSIDIYKTIDINIVLNRLFELYGHIYEYSNGLKGIYVEIGTELQSDTISSVEETKYILEKVDNFCKHKINHKPTFFVIQNGTKVLETENVGEYKNKIFDNIRFKEKILELTTLINSYGLFSKAHNCDYLDFNTLRTFPDYGINGVNIAPQYGIVETKALINLCISNGLEEELNEFYKLSFDSRKWEKWLKVDSNLSDNEKAVLSGHYIFSTKEFEDLANKIDFKLSKKGIQFNEVLYQTVYENLKESLLGLNWEVS